MSKKNTVIVINNRKYDAKTGQPLSETAAVKPITHPARQPAKHAPAHKPTTSRTLMRRAVSKPAVPAKRRVKVSGPLHRATPTPARAIVVKPASNALITKRLHRAKAIPKSQLISHFSSLIFSNSRDNTPASASAAPADAELRASRTAAPHSRPPAKPTTTAELLEYALKRATSHEQPPVEQKRHSLFRRRKPSVAGA